MLIFHDHISGTMLSGELKTISDFNLMYFNAYHYYTRWIEKYI